MPEPRSIAVLIGLQDITVMDMATFWAFVDEELDLAKNFFKRLVADGHCRDGGGAFVTFDYIIADDLDTMLGHIQRLLDIPTGNVAAQVFSGFDWETAGPEERTAKMAEYLKTEKAHAGPTCSHS